MIPLRAALIAVAAAAALPAPGADKGANDERLKQSTEELARVRARISALQAALERDRGQRDALRQSVQSAEQRIAAVLGELDRLRFEIGGQQKQIARTRSDQAQAQRELESQRQGLARQVRAAYLIGREPKIELLLSQDDPGHLTRVLTYYDYLNRARLNRMRAIQAQLAKLQALGARLQAQLDALQALQQQRRQALNDLETGRAERQAAMERLASRIRDQNQELQQRLADERELQKLIESLRDVLSDIPMDLGRGAHFAALKGRLPWPVQGHLLADYGDPKAGGKLRWNGIWVAGEAGAPVRAVAHGRVAYVGWMPRYGLILVIEHDDGYFTLYGYNQSVTRTVGEWIDAGDVIAALGDTGGQERPGLYFEIRKGAEPVDPTRWLKHIRKN